MTASLFFYISFSATSEHMEVPWPGIKSEPQLQQSGSLTHCTTVGTLLHYHPVPRVQTMELPFIWLLFLFQYGIKRELKKTARFYKPSCYQRIQIHFFSFFFFFAILGSHLRHMEVPRLWGQIRAAAASPHHSHNNAGSETHLQLTPQLTTTPYP